jgi:hypothetical protein
MKPFVITAVILSLLGFINCAGAFWVAFFGSYHLDNLLDPHNGPMSPKHMVSLKDTFAIYVELFGWFGISVGSLTIAWVASAFKFGKLYKAALSLSKKS